MCAKAAKKIASKPTGVMPESPDRFVLPGWAPIAAVLLTGLLYSRALQNGLTGFDDDFYITNNPFLRDFSVKGGVSIFTSFYSSNYHPLTTLSWLVEYKLFDLNPLPYHLTNVLLHMVNTWLVYKVVARLSGDGVAALIVSLLFGIHPMHVESVAWVSERKDVLYTAFYLAAILAYLRYLTSDFKRKYLIQTTLLFVAALLSKSAAMTLPVLLVVIDAYKGRPLNARSLAEKIPLFVLSILFGVLAILSQKAGGALSSLLASYGIVNALFLFTSGIAFYVIWLIIPFKLSVMHYFPDIANGMLPWQYYLSLPFVLTIIALVWRARRYRREIVFGFSFFLIVLSVMLQIVSVGSALTAERYSYVASIGLFYFIARWLSDILITPRRNMALAIVVLLTVLYSVETWDRIGTWKDDRLLFNDVIDKNPDVYYGYWLRGNLEKKEGDLQAAFNDYSESIRLNPKYEDAFYNRGIISDASGDTKSAIADFNRSIQLNPKQADAYNSRGWARFRLGDTTGAIEDYNKAIGIKPDYAEAYNNRGWAFTCLENTNAALKDYNKAISLKPGFMKPYYNRVAIKMKTGDFGGALADFNFLLRQSSEDGALYFGRGMAEHNLKSNDAACKDWEQASKLGYRQADAQRMLYCPY